MCLVEFWFSFTEFFDMSLNHFDIQLKFSFLLHIIHDIVPRMSYVLNKLKHALYLLKFIFIDKIS